MKVLLVEDETLVRRFIKSLIAWEEYGYMIAGEAANGEEALRIIESEQVDIVLTDIRMPLMSGFELIERIYAQDFKCEVIILSSYDDFEYVRTALRLHVSDYVHKATISEKELIATLGKARLDWVKRQEQFLLDRMIRHSHLDRHEQSAANLLTIAIESNYDGAYIQLLSEQLCIWNEQFDVSLMSIEDTINIAQLEADERIIFPYKKFWIIAGQRVHGTGDHDNNIVVVNGERRISLQEWPDMYAELLHTLEERLEEQDAARSFHSSIQKALEYLNGHYMDELTLEVMSELVHISPAYFSRLFMKETGQTFTDYLTALRLSHAKSVLIQSSLPVYEIAEQVGYRNTRYFSKLFKESFGLTPSEFRMQQS